MGGLGRSECREELVWCAAGLVLGGDMWLVGKKKGGETMTQVWMGEGGAGGNFADGVEFSRRVCAATETLLRPEKMEGAGKEAIFRRGGFWGDDVVGKRV